MKERKDIMRTKLYIIAILSALTTTAYAVTYGKPYSSSSGEYAAIQSQRVMNTGVNYNGSVYEPFSSGIPSEQSVVGAETSSNPNAGRNVRKGLIGGPEDPLGPSPVGEPWVMVIFAAAFCGVIALRRTMRKNRTL